MMILYLMACKTFHLFMGDDTAVDTGPAVEIQLNPVADIDWAQDGLRINLENGDGYQFAFGIAETSTECGIDTTHGCWTAEDCGGGYVSPQGTNAHPMYCHPLAETGGLLGYSEGLYSVIAGLGENYVVPGQKTGFPAPMCSDETLTTKDDCENGGSVWTTYEFKVTYYLQAIEIGNSNVETECWTWGYDPDHFAERNCKVPLPM